MKSPQANKVVGGGISPPFSVSIYLDAQSVKKITLDPSGAKGILFHGSSPHIPEILSWFHSYMMGETRPFPVPLSWENLSPFTLQVLRELSKIPTGKTLSYGEVAKRVGNAQAARAVGNACNRNPFPLVIPCHRVVGHGGKLGGFAYGSAVKRLLLDLEQQVPRVESPVSTL